MMDARCANADRDFDVDERMVALWRDPLRWIRNQVFERSGKNLVSD